ncbi:DUF1194 domain-containing protein [Microvirga sp. 3-52]|uniref:DUF1194 domain-containing protein n=1 Tax=Microvirga sp. 3-52 TaxID=2792425 RepID=UPI001AC62DA4|nr:DUF1194 domain-containing protein [Microvirga sp. 3-52]MBO1907174.1 DUF1194 domain-containing protein [Microvirga sp. 3-52]MBS7452101.1 DUF1194 domain-containing protein [Microvirga sp. 3-52]
MRYPKAPWLLSALVAGLLTVAPAWQRAPDEVDLALVLAVDVSTSMDPDEQDLQRRGYVEAFRSPSVHQAIHSGILGRIAVTYVEWAGAHPHVQNVVVPWTVLESAKDSLSFAERLARAPIRRGAGTSISEAIDFSLALFSSGPLLPTRRVIDISGDGANNQGDLVTEARDKAVVRGVTINGLPIMLRRPDRREDTTLDAYYRDCVIGGSNAFMIPVREPRQFLTETRTKIVNEIAEMPGVAGLIRPAGNSPGTDCDTSESLWDNVTPAPHAPKMHAGQEL